MRKNIAKTKTPNIPPVPQYFSVGSVKGTERNCFFSLSYALTSGQFILNGLNMYEFSFCFVTPFSVQILLKTRRRKKGNLTHSFIMNLQMQADESGISLTVSHLQQQAKPLRALDGQQKLQFIMEHRVPFILRCVLGPNENRRVHEQERYKKQKYGPDCGPKMDKLILTINCFTIAPFTSKISKELKDDDNKESIYLIYAGFSNFLRVVNGQESYYCYTAPLQPEPTPWQVEGDGYFIRKREQDAVCFLFELVPLDSNHFAIRSHAYQKFLRYQVSNRENKVRFTKLWPLQNLISVLRHIPFHSMKSF